MAGWDNFATLISFKVVVRSVWGLNFGMMCDAMTGYKFRSAFDC